MWLTNKPLKRRLSGGRQEQHVHHLGPLGVTNHSCCKEADFISTQRAPEGDFGLDKQLCQLRISWWCKSFSSLSSLKARLSHWLSQTNKRGVNTWVSRTQSTKVKQQRNFWENNRLDLQSTQIEVYCNCYILLSVNLHLLSANLYCAFSIFCITLLNQKSCVTSSIWYQT